MTIMSRILDYEGVSILEEARIENDPNQFLIYNYQGSDQGSAAGSADTHSTPSDVDLALAAKSYRQFLIQDTDNTTVASLIPRLHLQNGSSHATPQVVIRVLTRSAQSDQTRDAVLSSLLTASRDTGYDGSPMDVSSTMKLFDKMQSVEQVTEAAVGLLAQGAYKVLDNQKSGQSEPFFKEFATNLGFSPHGPGSFRPDEIMRLQLSNHVVGLLDSEERLRYAATCTLILGKDTSSRFAIWACGPYDVFWPLMSVMSNPHLRQRFGSKAGELKAMHEYLLQRSSSAGTICTSSLINGSKDLNPLDPPPDSDWDWMKELDQGCPMGIPMSSMPGVLDYMMREQCKLTRTELSQVCMSGAKPEDEPEVSAEEFAPYRNWSVVLASANSSITGYMDEASLDEGLEGGSIPYRIVQEFEPQV